MSTKAKSPRAAQIDRPPRGPAPGFDRFVAGLSLAASGVFAAADPCGDDRAPYAGDHVELRRAGLWHHDSYREPFVMGRVKRADGFASAPFRMGRASIGLRIQETHRWEPDGILRSMARGVAALPGVVVQRLPPLTREMNATDRPFASFEGDDYLVGFPLEAVQLENDGTPHLPLDFGLLLLHEFAHILDYHGGWSESAAWKRAVAASPCVVSDYAETSPQEDFAESVVAWLAYYQARVPHHVEEPEDWRYRRYMTQQRLERMALRKDYRERLGERFAVLGRLMHSPP